MAFSYWVGDGLAMTSLNFKGGLLGILGQASRMKVRKLEEDCSLNGDFLKRKK